MNNYENLQKVLKEIFEMDKADLDFGIYRIMNQKRDQVMDFIDRKLPKDIKDILAQTQSKDSASIQAELEQMGKSLDDAGVARESAPKYVALKAQLENAIDTNALEQEVFSHLANFFKRYYKDGDFISLRRYKKDVYAIPYEGEEVKLHWANHDQYYIKTSEYLKNYSFKLKDGKSVHFQLKEASTEQNNNKTQGDQERRFAIFEEQPVEIIDGHLYINFTYEPHKKAVKQAELEAKAIEVIQNNIPAEFTLAFDKAPTEKNKNRTIVEKHLNDFISRNSFDYFIHKDLGGFLSRELDFYIKNEVLYIDDINTENPAYFTAQLSKIKALKTVASKIITFLAQIEDFQKKLWLKKKFVISTNYCITLDRIPEKYYAEIAANQAQLDEWKELFDIVIPSTEAEALEALRNEPYLVLDTKHFSEEFKDKLLAEFDNLDEEINGLLINSDNFQAMNLLSKKYTNNIQSVYIDPPFNLEHSGEFLYKTDFLDSSWIQLLYDRVNITKDLLSNTGVIGIRSDYHGDYYVRALMNNIFGLENFRNQNAINRIFKNKTNVDVKTLSYSFDYLTIYSKNNQFVYNNPVVKLEKEREAYWRHMNDSEGQGSSKVFFGLELNPPLGKHFKYSQVKIDEKINIGELRLDCRDCKHLHYEGQINSCPSCGSKNMNPKYLVKSTDEKVLGTNWTDISGYSNTTGFSTENAEILLKRFIDITSKEGDIILDYFVGSGTTISVSHKMNRKWIGVEMGKYFNEFPLVRMKRVLNNSHKGISKDVNWNGGGLFVYQVLESYEDVLNNLALNSKYNESILQFDSDAQQEYLISYMLDVETQDHLFNVLMFRNPFNYQLKVTENNELVPTKVDLVETFNYLIGLYVERMQRVGDIKFVEGKTREGIKTLIIWRNLETTSNEETAQRFRKIYDSVRSSEFDQIYINGDHHFDNMRIGDDTFKVKLIEETFFKQMFNISEL